MRAVRTTCPLYMESVRRYFDVLFEQLAPLLYHNGGAVIAIQVENEYGNFGYDAAYMASIFHLMRSVR